MAMYAQGMRDGMTRGPASSCVYIERESRLYKAVRGLVLTSACCVPSVI